MLEYFFYIKKALGKNGKPMNIWKLRTMYVGAEKDFDSVSVGGLDNLGKPKNDPRITRLGRFLRRYWIDEIPQLYNLLMGDLKLIGIRPKQEVYWNKSPQLRVRALKYKPGLIAANYIILEEQYLDEYEQNPIITDRYILTEFLRRVFKEGLRSR